MQCPVDGETLLMAERSGVEIDYCPRCRGVWLDRGELDKIIERAGAAPSPARAVAPDPYAPVAQPEPPRPAPAPRDDGRRRDHDDDDRRRYGDDDHYRRKKRKSFLDDIFDF